MLSARSEAHCGWMPPREYDFFPHTGQSGMVGPVVFGFEWFIRPQPSWRESSRGPYRHRFTPCFTVEVATPNAMD